MVFILNSNIEKEKREIFILEWEHSYVDGIAIFKDGKVFIHAGKMGTHFKEYNEYKNKAMMGVIGYD